MVGSSSAIRVTFAERGEITVQFLVGCGFIEENLDLGYLEGGLGKSFPTKNGFGASPKKSRRVVQKKKKGLKLVVREDIGVN